MQALFASATYVGEKLS